jgi:3-dehydroquinate synthase
MQRLKAPYDILIGRDILSSIGPRLKKEGFSSKVVIITNAPVNDLYGLPVKESLLTEDFEVIVLEIPDTEKSKSMEMVLQLYDELIRYEVERTTPLIALGGGVVGDLAGFVAATFLRGIPLIHLPTTLLAQVDSSLGEKTGVNRGSAKNMIGAFKDPQFVLTDLDTLGTLPEDEQKNGIAEIIKYGMIADCSLFMLLEERMNDLLSLNPVLLEDLIEQCCTIKIRVMHRDREDHGMRRILNYGHTVGHALEAASDFTISHGEAVAIGMCAAARIAEKMGILSTEAVHRQEELIAKAGLPTTLPPISTAAVLEKMQYDKKRKNSRITFVLPEGIGTVVIRNNVPKKTVVKVLEGLQ